VKVFPQDLTTYLNKHINKICPFAAASTDMQNQCAHFVAHVMNYEFPGMTCKQYTIADIRSPNRGVTIRVNDLFNNLSSKSSLDKKPVNLQSFLLFVTLSSNMTGQSDNLKMGDHPSKHVGILINGKVWHYSNSHHRVLSDEIEVFQAKFESSYASKCSDTARVNFYYGEFL